MQWKSFSVLRYGNDWGDWHGEKNQDIESVELNPGTLIKGVEAASIDSTSFYMLQFTMSDGSQQILGVTLSYETCLCSFFSP